MHISLRYAACLGKRGAEVGLYRGSRLYPRRLEANGLLPDQGRSFANNPDGVRLAEGLAGIDFDNSPRAGNTD